MPGNILEKFNAEKFTKSLNTTRFGRKLLYFDSIGSTNDHCGELIKKSQSKDFEKLDGTIVFAEKQTSGRGRFKHEWLSPEGGLWFSLIIITDIHPERLPNLTLIAAFSISEAILDTYGLKVDIKWPNDLYHGEYKFGGILSEFKKKGELQAIILGIGINANIEDKALQKLDNMAVSIKKVLGKNVDREILMARILDNLERSYDYFSKTGDFSSIFAKWEKNIRYQ